LLGSKPWRAKTEDLKVFHELDWDCGSHSVSHPRFKDISQDEVDWEARTSKEFLVKEGFIIGVDHFSYPQSAYSVRDIEIIKKYYKTARTVSGKITKTIPLGDDWYKLDCISMKASDSPAKALQKIDEAINEVGVVHLMFEYLRYKDPPAQAYLARHFEIIIEYASELIETNKLVNSTVSEYYDNFISSP
jgi:peptidoglycan/xylan/chitin deacetylase (PgdA/CDA1 family)